MVKKAFFVYIFKLNHVLFRKIVLLILKFMKNLLVYLPKFENKFFCYFSATFVIIFQRYRYQLLSFILLLATQGFEEALFSKVKSKEFNI